MNSEKLLVQASEADVDGIQTVAQCAQLVRGIACAVFVFFFAEPLFSAIFDLREQSSWAFRCLGLMLFVGAFRHLDIYRFHREMRYGPEICVEIAGQIVGGVVGGLLAYFYQSYLSVLCGLLFQWIAVVSAGHILAAKRYSIGFDVKIFTKIWRFGGPLLVNGMLMFAIFQGDRIVVGSWYGPTALGVFGVTLGLFLLPTITIARISQSLFLPALGAINTNTDRFFFRCRLMAEGLTAVATSFSVFVIVAGGSLVVVVYGGEYADASGYAAILGVGQAIWMLRLGPTLGTLAKGESLTTLMSSAVRASGIIMSFAFAYSQWPITYIACSMLASEAAAFVSSTLISQHRAAIPAIIWLRPAVIAICAPCVASVIAIILQRNATPPIVSMVTGIVVGSFSLGGMLIAFPATRIELRRFVIDRFCAARVAQEVDR